VLRPVGWATRTRPSAARRRAASTPSRTVSTTSAGSWVLPWSWIRGLARDVGLAFLDAHKPARFVAATTGGSVARREADEYSDLDLNIYVDDTEEHRSENRQFAGEIIQLHIHPFPRVEAVRQSPWDYRFLREAGVICDPAGRYESFAREALPWLGSADGVSAACDLALADVEKRQSWAEEAILRRDHMEMGMASMAAMTDAAMLYGVVA